MFYYIARIAVYIVLMIFYKPRFEGLENVPKDKGFILVSNHISNFDPIFVAVKVKPRCYFMARGRAVPQPLCQPDYPGGLGPSRSAAARGTPPPSKRRVGYVKEGKVVAIFPEGHRSPDGKLQKLKSGAVVIAAETGGGMQPCVVRKGPKKGLRTPGRHPVREGLSPTRSWASPAAPRPRSGRPISCSPKP